MRIQQTDRILKESRYARHTQAMHDQGRLNMVQRVWRALSGIFK